jgi:hypothetical protein
MSKSNFNDVVSSVSSCSTNNEILRGCDSNQIWKKLHIPGSSDTFELMNLNSGKCLNVKGASTDNGAQIIQWPCDPNQTNQVWKYTNGQLININSKKCLDVPWGQLSGAKMLQWDCNNGDNQKWTSYGNGYLINKQSGRCLDVPFASTDDGELIQQWNCKFRK